ncbi:MAG: AAA family ATPase [Candidatus Hydrothermarchaeales archaeon]
MKIIGFSGKGGTGKTTLTVLFLKALMNMNNKEILLIDSDPNECLPSVLGIDQFMRLSDVVKGYEGKTIDPAQFSQDFNSMLLMNEQDGFDLMVMGRGESEGCYCIINHLLKSSFEQNVLSGGPSYDYILMDCEAGIEHISRKTSSAIHDLVVVTDASMMGIRTMERIKKVSNEVKSSVKRFHVAANKIQNPEMSSNIEEKASQLDMHYLGSIPYDPVIEEYNFLGKPLLGLPEDSLAYLEAKKMVDSILAV